MAMPACSLRSVLIITARAAAPSMLIRAAVWPPSPTRSHRVLSRSNVAACLRNSAHRSTSSFMRATPRSGGDPHPSAFDNGFDARKLERFLDSLDISWRRAGLAHPSRSSEPNSTPSDTARKSMSKMADSPPPPAPGPCALASCAWNGSVEREQSVKITLRASSCDRERARVARRVSSLVVEVTPRTSVESCPSSTGRRQSGESHRS
mmetsp:Transcript_7466/g.14376  ORF Transcript_7466/g.14376 Transcript_7466/m.14376 type:complete len:207 (-) Transcript_7466:2386-3006(-)